MSLALVRTEEGDAARNMGPDTDQLGRYRVDIAGVPRDFVRTRLNDLEFVPPQGGECQLKALWDFLEAGGYELFTTTALKSLSEQLPKRYNVIVAMRMPGRQVMMAGRRAFFACELPAESQGLQPSAEIVYLLPL